jgi:hypothetical protein
MRVVAKSKEESAAWLSLAVLVGLLGLGASACVHEHVAPYDRGKLAHPTMTTSDLSGPAESHVHAVHEGAAGGGALGESGCGCN